MEKIALVTGATSGIGRATAHLLAQSGWSLIITGRRRKRLDELKIELEKMGAPVMALCFDVRKKEEVEMSI